jgi:hypothetical protein
MKRRLPADIDELPISSSLSPTTSYLSISKKTLFHLIATLNAVYSDYDFSDIPLDSLRFTSLSNFVKRVESSLCAYPALEGLKTIWNVLDTVIPLEEAEIFEYLPEKEEELWRFCFLLYHKGLKRILYFGCRCVSYVIPLFV